jgi:AraC family transcriptional regulator
MQHMAWAEVSKHASASVGASPLTNHHRNSVQRSLRYKRSWSGITAEVVELHGPGPYLAAHSSDKPLLVVALEEIGGTLETRLSPDRPAPSQYSGANQVTFVSPGTPLWEYAKQFNYIRRIVIEFDVKFLRASDQNSSKVHFKFPAPLRFSSASLSSLAELVADECVEPQSDDRHYGDSLGRVLYHNLIRHADAEQAGQRSRGLTPKQLRTVTEHMEQSSFSCVQVHDMARIVGISQSYFSRAFKSSTGMSPLRWLRKKRIERAQQILLETEQSLVDIALQTGFADQSHFTRTFRNIVGESPGAWRKNIKFKGSSPISQRT